MDEETRAFEEWAKTNSNKAVLGAPVTKEDDTETADFEKWAAQQEVMPTPMPIEKKDASEYIKMREDAAQVVKKNEERLAARDPKGFVKKDSVVWKAMEWWLGDNIEEAKNQIDNLIYCEQNGIPVTLAKQFSNHLKEEGKANLNMMKVSGSKSAYEKIMPALEAGTIKDNLQLKWNNFLMMNPSDKGYEEAKQDIAKTQAAYWEAMKNTPLAENLLEDAFMGAADFVPGMARMAGESSTYGMLVAMLVAGGAYVAGAPVAVPTSLAFAVGSSYKITQESAKREAGGMAMQLFKERDEKGNPYDIEYIRAVAQIGGQLAGLVELAQFRSIAKLFPGADKLVSKAVLATLTSKKVRQQLAYHGKNLIIEPGKQTGEEVIQGIITEVIMPEVLNELNNAAKGTNFKAETVKKIASVVTENLKEYKSFMALGVFGSAAQTVKVTKDAVLGGKDKKTTFADKEDGGGAQDETKKTDTIEPTDEQKQVSLETEPIENFVKDKTGEVVIPENTIAYRMEEPGEGGNWFGDMKIASAMGSVREGKEQLISVDVSGKRLANIEDYITQEQQFNFFGNSQWGSDLTKEKLAEIVDKAVADGYDGLYSAKTRDILLPVKQQAKKEDTAAKEAQTEADKQRELEELDETAAESLDMLDENDRVIMAGWGNMKSLPNGEVVYQKTGEGTQLNPARAPENPLIVKSREGLAEFLKYEGDPYSTEFDKIAKDYAEQDNRDGIIYAETKDGTPEMRVFTNREGTSFIIKGQDPTEALKDKSLTFKKFDAFFEEMDARRQELEKEAFVGDPTDRAIKEMANASGTNELFREKMSDLYEQARNEQVNMLLNMASRMTEKQGENMRALDQYSAMDDEASSIAVQKAIDKVSRQLGSWRRKAIALAKENIRHFPLYSAMEHIVKNGGLNEESLKLVYPEVAAEIAKRRPGLVSKKGTLKADEIAQEFGFESADALVEGIFEWKGLENEAVRVANAEFEQILQMLGENERDGFLETYREEKEAALKKLSAQNKPRPAKGIGKVIKKETGITRDDSKQVTEYEALTAGYKRAREAGNFAVRWSFRRRAEMKNIQEYLHLTDAQMQKVSRRSPYLMTDAEYADYKQEVMRRAVELQENRYYKQAVLHLIAEKKLRKVNMYRQLLGYPPITKMTTEEAKGFFEALDKYEEGDVFLSKKKLETIDRSKLLDGVRTEREVVERIAKHSGKDPKDLKVATVPRLMLFYWDSLLKRQGAFWDVFVTRITESLIRGEVRHTQIEDLIRVLGKKAHSSRSRSIKEMALQTDQKIFEWMSAEDETAQAQIEAQLTDAELDLAHSMRQYFSECLEYLQAMEILGEGRNGYMTHVRQGFLENWSEEGLKKAVKNIRERLKDDEARFITRDENGQILSPEKHFVYAIHRSGEVAPSKNVIKSFLAYSGAFERMRSLNETLPELMALGQITAEQNPLVQNKMQEAIRNYLNNKKGIRFTWGGAIPQGSMRERALNMMQAFTSLWILGGNLFVGTANIVGEQVASLHEYGHKAMALGAKRLATTQGRHIVELNKSWVGRTAWDDFTAPGNTLGERLDTAAFALFAEASRLTNAQVLLASLTDAEFNSGEVTPARLADIKLRMGNVRMVQGTASIAGSSAAGRNWTMFKRWAIPLTEYVSRDIYNLGKDIAQGKEGMFTSDHAKRLGSSLITLGVVAVSYFAVYPDDDDDSYIGRFIRNLFREAMTIAQAFTSLSGNLLPVPLAYLSDLIYAIGLCLSIDDTKRKRGIREIQRFKPGFWRTLPFFGTYATEDTRKKKRNKEW